MDRALLVGALEYRDQLEGGSPLVYFVCAHYAVTLVLIGSCPDPGRRRCPRQPRSCHRDGGWAAGGRHSGWYGRDGTSHGQAGGSRPRNPRCPRRHRGGNSRSRPNRDFGIHSRFPDSRPNRDFRFPDSPDHSRPNRESAPARGPESRKVSRSRPNRESNPGKRIESQFFCSGQNRASDRTLRTASGRPRLVQFVFPGRIGARRDGAPGREWGISGSGREPPLTLVASAGTLTGRLQRNCGKRAT
jgi:hypothetical protein